MVRKILPLLLALLLLLGGCEASTSSGDRVIVATIYPVYVTALNITRDVPGIEIRQLLPASAGCGHDYQLTTEDMKAVADAELILSNGLGIETYLSKLREAYPELPLLDTAKNIELIEDHGEINPHVWMDPQAVIMQAEEICRYMSSIDEKNSATYEKNKNDYIARLQELDTEMQAQLAPLSNRQAISYHNAFDYFARRFNFSIAAEIAHSEDAQPSSAHIVEIIEDMKELGVTMAWLEDEGELSAVQSILDETGAKALLLSTVTEGEAEDYDAYINAQKENARLIAESAS